MGVCNCAGFKIDNGDDHVVGAGDPPDAVRADVETGGVGQFGGAEEEITGQGSDGDHLGGLGIHAEQVTAIYPVERTIRADGNVG